jgi:hypothetical protein
LIQVKRAAGADACNGHLISINTSACKIAYGAFPETQRNAGK